MYHPRTLEDALLSASGQFPVVLVTGPRQVGKTTLLQHLCEQDRRYVTLDDLVLRQLANDDPALFLQRFPAPLLIDEIQYAPDLLPYIKMAVDSSSQAGAFWLTGSQQFHLMKGVSESLAGRVAVIQLLGFSGRERRRDQVWPAPFLATPERLSDRAPTGVAPTLDRVFADIWEGSFPGLVAGPVRDRDLFYSSYLQTYLQRDVRDLARVGDEQAFLGFVRACAARTGCLLNLSELARDVDVTVKTAKHWLSILTTSFQVYLLPPYHSNITKRLVKTPKLYFLDTGLCAYLTEWSSPQTLAAGAMRGAIFETYVFSEILKSWWHRVQMPQMYHFRDRDGREIDFVFVQDQTLYPVEVKLGAAPRTDWVRPFKSLDRFPTPRGDGAVVCLCSEPIPLTREATAVPVGYL